MRGVRLIVADDPDDLARRAAQLFVEAARISGDRFVVALSGGSTPRRFHTVLAREMGDRVEWPKVHILLSDERALPATDPNSNYRMVQETLLEPLGLAASQAYAPGADRDDLAAAAADYERVIKELTGSTGGVDLLVLGMGDDGHTASLFPGHVPPSGLVAAAEASEGTVANKRLTFTFEAIRRARSTVVLVSGEKKATRLHQVLTEDGALPMQRVLRDRQDQPGGTIIIADRAAITELDPSRIEELQ